MPIPPGSFGTWSPNIDPVERVAQFRSLAALAALLIGSGHPLIAELRAAEIDRNAAERALALLEALPSLTRRRLISTFAAITFPYPRKGSKPRRKRPSIAPREGAATSPYPDPLACPEASYSAGSPTRLSLDVPPTRKRRLAWTG